jgi:hypothetical protein
MFEGNMVLPGFFRVGVDIEKLLARRPFNDWGEP